MKTTHRHLLGTLLILVLSVFGGALHAQEAVGEPSENDLLGKTVVVKVTDALLGDSLARGGIEKVLAAAEAEKAAAVVLEIDCRSGDPADALDLMESISALEIPTVAWVNRSATSGGAWIALGADRIYLIPGGRIGGAAPVLPGGGDAEAVQESRLAQMESVAKARVRGVAKAQGHRPAVAEAFADADEVLEIESEVLSAEGELLVLDSEEAARRFGGETLLAEGTASSLDEVLEKAGFDGEVRRIGNPAQFARDLRRQSEPGSALAAGSDSEGPVDDMAEEEVSAFKTKEAAFTGKVVVIPIGESNLMSSQRFRFMLRMLDRADEEGAAAVVFDMDTPGGLAWDTNTLMARLQRLKVPSYSFVNTRALSAGALISCATDAIYMAPSGSIGAAAVVNSGGSIGETERAKYDSAFDAMSRGAIREKGYHLDIVKAMKIPSDKVIEVGGEELVGVGEILTLDARQAVMPYKGSTVLARGIVPSIDALLAAEGIEAETVEAEPLGFERIAQWITLPVVTSLLLAVGALGGWTELKAPGFGIAGGISLIAFSLFFFGHYIAGYLAGWEAIAMLAFGVFLIVVEIFLLPGMLIFGVTGALLAVAGLVYTMAGLDFRMPGWSVEEVTVGTFHWPIINLGVAMIASVIGVLVLMRFLPETKLMNRLILGAEVQGGTAQGDQPKASASGPREGLREWIGEEGVAETPLRPAGRVRFQETVVDVIADSGWIDAGSPVRAISQQGGEVVVEEIG